MSRCSRSSRKAIRCSCISIRWTNSPTCRQDTLVLPSHGKPFRGLHTRIAQLREHHTARLAEVLQACRAAGVSAVDIVPIMFRRPLDTHQLSFALGEALAHLHKLWFDGILRRVTGADGIYPLPSDLDQTARSVRNVRRTCGTRQRVPRRVGVTCCCKHRSSITCTRNSVARCARCATNCMQFSHQLLHRQMHIVTIGLIPARD